MRIIKESFPHRFPGIHEAVTTGLWPRLQDAVFARALGRKLGGLLETDPFPLPHKVEIEIFNRCNNTCPFCPVNRDVDPRKPKKMTEELFGSILDQLRDIGFSGRLALHSNNEPLLDRRITDFARRAKGAVPHALVYLQTNGTQLTVDLFVELMRSLDRIVINNYEDELEMIEPVRRVYEYCLDHPWAGDRVAIHMKRMTIKRSNRAGRAPNRERLGRPLSSPCIRPFYELIIRPDGKLSLCCFDALGRMTMGDLSETGLVAAWRGEEYRGIRETMLSERSKIPLCAECDELVLGESLAIVERRGNLRNISALLGAALPGRRG